MPPRRTAAGQGRRTRRRGPAAWRTVTVVTRVPMMAMPSALPTWRIVLLVPLATPDLSTGISQSTTFVICEVAMPLPRP